MNPRRKKLQRWLVGVLVAVALYALIGFLLVPAVARRQIEQRAAAALGRDVAVAGVYFNPFTFFAAIDELRIAGGGDEVIASWSSAEANFDAFESLFRWEWRFGEVRLVDPQVRLVVDEAGNLNWADLIEPKDEPKGPPPRIGVDRLTLERGSVVFVDRSRAAPFASTIEPISFALENFSTKPDEAGAYRLSGTTAAGESFDWRGVVAVEPVASHGRIEFTGIDLPAYMPFVSPYLAGEIRSGKLTLTAEYRVLLGRQREATLANVAVRLNRLALALPGSPRPAIELPELIVDVPKANLLELSAEVARIVVTGLSVHATRQADGQLDLASLIPVAADSSGPPAITEGGGTSGSNAVDVRVAEIALREGRFVLTDRTLPQPAEIEVDEVDLTILGASTELAKEVEFQLELRWAQGPGAITASGTLRPEPFTAEVQLEGAQLAVAPAAPYLQQFANVRLLSGQAEFGGRMELEKSADAPFHAHWTGRVAINDLATQDTQLGHDLLGFGRLALERSEFTLEPRRLAIEELRLENPAVHVLIDASGTMNLAAAFGSSSPGEAGAAASGATVEPPVPGAGSLPFEAEIQTITIEGGRVVVNDQSVEPAFSVEISDFGGAVRGLSTAPGRRAELDLSASIAGSAPVTIRGTVNPLAADVLSGSEVVVDLRGLRMELFETYVARYLGHRIDRGRMRGDFQYRVSGDMLDGHNHVVLDRFFLGENVESPDAIGVPVKLALAVMRNRQGEIVLDVPVSGSLRSPEFSFAGAVRDAFVNSLSKVATAPFALLGSMFGAPDADLSQVEFPPGAAELAEGTEANLDALARALKERPALELTIHWEPRPDLDRQALRERQLDELLSEERERLRVAGREGSAVTDQEALRALYLRRAAAEDGDGESPEAARPEPPVERANEERPPWLVRVYRYLFGRPGELASASGSAPAEAVAASGAAPAAEQLSPEQMQQQLLATISIDDATFADLAESRAQTARNYLMALGIEPDRIEVASTPGVPRDKPGPVGAARVAFALGESSTEVARNDTRSDNITE